jgi:hypothetical protein
MEQLQRRAYQRISQKSATEPQRGVDEIDVTLVEALGVEDLQIAKKKRHPPTG